MPGVQTMGSSRRARRAPSPRREPVRGEERVRSRGSLLHADPGMSQEPGGLRQARGVPRGAGVRGHGRPRRRRPRRRQHVRLHRGGPPGVDRHRLDAGRAPPSRRPPRRHRLHGRALRRRAARRAARGRPRRRLRPRPRRARRPRTDGAVPVALGATRTGPPQPAPAGGFDLLELPRPAARAPVGLREGGRGMRPHLRLLRHPVVPGQAALAHPRRRPRRGRPPPRSHRHRRRAAAARGRARRAGPRLLRT